MLLGRQGAGRSLLAPEQRIAGDADQGRLEGVWIYVDGQGQGRHTDTDFRHRLLG